ncbi:MAG TPA: RCC1 domain-containing protein [Clostridia bacterium]
MFVGSPAVFAAESPASAGSMLQAAYYTTISAGHNFLLALKDNGTVAAGGDHSVALKEDGTVAARFHIAQLFQC